MKLPGEVHQGPVWMDDSNAAEIVEAAWATLKTVPVWEALAVVLVAALREVGHDSRAAGRGVATALGDIAHNAGIRRMGT